MLCEDGGGGEASAALGAWRRHTEEAELPELDLAARRAPALGLALALALGLALALALALAL
jgi:hypothetical protein|tara:strand:- start:72 stop:254 length:183 start_codon:yes stop_codon:yes gene_type:complete